MAKKVVTRHVGGLEAPRNNLELPVEITYGICAGRDSKQSSEKNSCSIEAPIKKLIGEEISKGSNPRQKAPSIVARLMGVDMFPDDSRQAPKMVGRRNDTPAGKLEKERSKEGLVGNDPYVANSSPQLGSFSHNFDDYSDHCSSQMKFRKPKPREHPQEEELQKFKKEFEAWQAARFKECSKVIEFGNAPDQLIAQGEGELNEEINYLHANSSRMENGESLMETKDLSIGLHEMLISRNWGKKKGDFLDGLKESLYSKRRSKTDILPSQLMNAGPKVDIVSVPTKIVILRPGPDRRSVGESSWNSTPSTFDERGSIEDFLEEVKERLKSELQGKSSKRSTIIRGGGIETPYREKPSEPRQIAQRIAQQVRDSVTRDLGMNLIRSESTRSYRSDIQLNGAGSPELINRDTRRSLTERLRNVLKGETYREIPTVSHERLRSPALDYGTAIAGQSTDEWTDNNISCCEMNDEVNQSRSFGLDPDGGGMHYKEPSPGNLVRSLSAPPVSGTSFGKLLLKDRHILAGAEIRMKHEVVENVSMNVKIQKKDKFNIREKVSSFGNSLTLRKRLFRRRVQSLDELQYNRDDIFNDIASGPTVIMSSCESHENYTEVPPSPASVCSSDCNEFWRPAAFSTPTSSDVNQLEDSEMSAVFRQINSDDLGRQLNQLECTDLKGPIIEEQLHEVEVDIEDPIEAYVRDLLVASGYYNGSRNQSLSKWNPLGKPVSNQVFEEVEETHRRSAKVNETCAKGQGSKINHGVILDLLNEVLPTVLRQPENMCDFGKSTASVHKPLHGRELLRHIWQMIRVYVHPPPDRSYYVLDSMLAEDLKSDPWSRLIVDDINALDKDFECHITRDLIEEIIRDMFL